MLRRRRLPHPRTDVFRRLPLGVAMLGIVVLAACDTPAGDEDAGAGCAETVREASFATEVAEQVRLLDTALVTCRSYTALTAQLDRYPGIIGYDAATFVTLRCERVDDEAIRSAATCAEVITPATTPPPTTVAEVVFVGDTLDGRRIEIRPSATTRFEGDVPEIVQQTVDIAIESGCEGVIEQRDLWASRTDDPDIGDEASVYARHAQNVADYIQCDSEPIELG